MNDGLGFTVFEDFKIVLREMTDGGASVVADDDTDGHKSDI